MLHNIVTAVTTAVPVAWRVPPLTRDIGRSNQRLGPAPAIKDATGGVVSSSHVSVARGASSEEIVGGLAAQGVSCSLVAARPGALDEATGVEMHQHILIEVAG